jgi:hypothetical protein
MEKKKKKEGTEIIIKIKQGIKVQINSNWV